MILSFADKVTAAVFAGLQVRRLPHEIQDVARRKLKLLDAVMSLESLRAPGNRLALRGDRRPVEHQDQRPIAHLPLEGHGCIDAEIVDYH
jgi:proteic killer suppression protein